MRAVLTRHSALLATATVVVAAAAAAGGCGETANTKSAPVASGTVWLCRPGAKGDPCTRNLDATVVTGTGARVVQKGRPAVDSKFDCFYVYPTVSLQKTANANLKIQPAEIGTAVEQASRFSQVCRVWAPMYRQQTVASLLALSGYQQAIGVAYASLLSGWRDYLVRHNDGRPFVLVGHSQGAALLILLIRRQIDSNPELRKRLVSAVLLGGNVQVPVGKGVGGSFQHIPACRRISETGCVIAYSSFPQQPPGFSLFGRPGEGVSVLSGQSAGSDMQVLCVNPAAVGGGTAPLEPYFTATVQRPPGKPVGTPWVTYPDLYTASCRSSGGATWLQVDTVAGRGDTRPRVTETDGAIWGYHVADVNLALGNLVADVKRQEAAYQARH